jgi:hypothetical protein
VADENIITGKDSTAVNFLHAPRLGKSVCIQKLLLFDDGSLQYEDRGKKFDKRISVARLLPQFLIKQNVRG